jgi:hypothetical protein
MVHLQNDLQASQIQLCLPSATVTPQASQPTCAFLDLAEMEGRLPVPSCQNGLHRQIRRLLKNLLQLLLYLLRNAIHGNPSRYQNGFLSYDDWLS